MSTPKKHPRPKPVLPDFEKLRDMGQSENMIVAIMKYSKDAQEQDKKHMRAWWKYATTMQKMAVWQQIQSIETDSHLMIVARLAQVQFLELYHAEVEALKPKVKRGPAPRKQRSGDFRHV
jgi:hypothetical protein